MWLWRIEGVKQLERESAELRRANEIPRKVLLLLRLR
jgi:hypothetical protein